MSLYTPVFPSIPESSSLRKVSLENNSAGAPGKQHNYIELLRDVHLFLSTKNDVLSPPSRPNSPLSDHRVQKVKEQVQDVFNATGGGTSKGQWARVSQSLKLGCVRGRYRSLPRADPCTSGEDANWILPDEESEWLEWEKKREETRRLTAVTNASQGIGSTAPAALDSLKPNHTNGADLTQHPDKLRERAPRDVSPTTLRAAKEKVRKWQASVAPEAWHSTASGSPSSSVRPVIGTPAQKDQAERPQRTRTLDFAVVKPAANSTFARKGNGIPSHPVVPSSGLSKASIAPGEMRTVEHSADERPLLHRKDSPPKIGDVPETPYLPPSFPAHLETSTPLPDPLKVVRAKPSPILPLAITTTTPPLQAVADPPDDRQLGPADSHAAIISSSLPPQVNTVQSAKRTLSSLEGTADDTRATPSAKRLQTLSQNGSRTVFKPPQPILPIRESDFAPCSRDDTKDPSFSAASSHQQNMDTHETTTVAPLTPGKKDQAGAGVRDSFDRIPSPTKSVKSYFSTPDSDSAESPMKANLLLESPVSPMLSYARNPSGFLPQMTSTQVGKGSSADGTNGGVFGMAYSSQFDVERQVDRVSELLEKDVDFDGWLRDVRTVE